MRTIRNAMKFIQDSTSVESVLAESQQTVEKLLRIVAKSIQSVHEYLDATKLGNGSELSVFGAVLICPVGRVRKTDSTGGMLREYKRQVHELCSELYGVAIVNMKGKLTSMGSKSMAFHRIFAEIHGTLTVILEASYVVIPPPPTDIFTGREDYLAQMEQVFDFTKTSMELKKQRKFVLYGIGGMGKTQIALKFRERHCDK